MANKNPNAYADVAAILDAALAMGGGVYTLPSHGRAIRWAHRAYSLRLSLRNIQVLLPGQAPSTPYDNIELRVEDLGKDRRAEPHKVQILLKTAEGVLTDLEGNPLEPMVKTVTPARDKHDDAFEELLKGLEQ